MTHFGFGSSEEDPWGSLMRGWRWVTFPGTSAVCLGGSAVPLGSLGALHLAECLAACLPAWVTTWCLPGLRGVVTCLESAFPCRSFRGDLAACLGGALSLGRWEIAWLSAWVAACLPAWVEGELLPAWEGPSLAGRWLGVTALPAWGEALSLGQWETAWLPAWVIACLSACLTTCLRSY